MHSLAERPQKFTYFLLAMLLVHGLFLVTKVKQSSSLVNFTHEEAIKVKLVASETTQKLMKQIVQSEDGDANREVAEKAFLSDKNRTFDRETIARNVDTFKKAALGNAAVTQKAQQVNASKKKKTPAKDLKLSDFGMKVEESAIKPVERVVASESVKGLQNGDLASVGLSQTNDYVQEVTLGDFTHLNTVEYKFYGFYHRIRQKLEQFWGQSIQEKSRQVFRSGRRMPAGEDLITSLRITLNDKGEIVAVKVLGTSGVKELDDAAIESFNQAGPFPNPPKELLVNGKAVIEWGFVVKS